MSAQTYLIPISEIKESSYVDENVSDKLIKVSSLDAQEMILEPVLGTKLYDKLLDDVNNNNVNDANEILLTKYIWPVLIQGTIFKLSYNLLFRITNSTVAKDDNQNSKGISVNELNVLIKERELSMNYHITKLKTFLTAYPGLYPDYLGTQPVDGEAPERATNNLSFWNYDDE